MPPELLAGMPPPPEEPEPLRPELLWLWRAWHRLDGDRPWRPGGMGPSLPGRIPWSVTHAFAAAHGLTVEDREMLEHCIGAMDTVLLDHLAAERARAQAAAA
jgi:hypothetical protein